MRAGPVSKVLGALRLESAAAGEREATAVSLLYALLAVAVAGLVVHGAYFGSITALLLRSLFFSMVAAAGLAAAALPMRSAWARMACYLLAAVALVPGPYLWHGFHDIIMRGAIATEADQIVFLTLLVASMRSEEHTSELQSLMRITDAVFCLKKTKKKK